MRRAAPTPAGSDARRAGAAPPRGLRGHDGRGQSAARPAPVRDPRERRRPLGGLEHRVPGAAAGPHRRSPAPVAGVHRPAAPDRHRRRGRRGHAPLTARGVGADPLARGARARGGSCAHRTGGAANRLHAARRRRQLEPGARRRRWLQPGQPRDRRARAELLREPAPRRGPGPRLPQGIAGGRRPHDAQALPRPRLELRRLARGLRRRDRDRRCRGRALSVPRAAR